jgi:hypothetical protein
VSRIDVHAEVATLLGGFPDVFSTVQWGGRAYKLGNPRKPRLLAFVSSDDPRRVCVTFKLPRPRAGEVVDRHAWIRPHEFRTLAPAGWVTATASCKRHLQILTGLLSESRALYPVQRTGPRNPPPAAAPAPGVHPDAARIDRVMALLRDRGGRAEGQPDP